MAHCCFGAAVVLQQCKSFPSISADVNNCFSFQYLTVLSGTPKSSIGRGIYLYVNGYYSEQSILRLVFLTVVAVDFERWSSELQLV